MLSSGAGASWSDVGESEFVATVSRLSDQEKLKLAAKTRKSASLHVRSRKSMPGGVGNGYHTRIPYPLFWSKGEGGSLEDVDGNVYSDFFLANGSMIVGHGNPAVSRSVAEAVAQGSSHLGGPSADTIEVAENLVARFGLPSWRFANTGTEVTRAAIQVARAVSRREAVVKIESGYHGIHESVCVSFWPPLAEAGPPDAPASVVSHGGVPQCMAELTRVVPFNCREPILRARLENRDVAAVILEPVMMNVGIVEPNPGFLAMVRRLCTEFGTLLILDEVKTGLTLGPRGAVAALAQSAPLAVLSGGAVAEKTADADTGVGGCTEAAAAGAVESGVRLDSLVVPDLLCLAKSLGGGLPVSALGMSAAIASLVASGEPTVASTAAASALGMAAARATLTKVLRDDATYGRLATLNRRLRDGVNAVCAAFRAFPARCVSSGAAKGAIVFFEPGVEPFVCRDYRDVCRASGGRCAWALYELLTVCLANDGVWLGTEGDEEYTLCISHDEHDVDRFVTSFRRMVSAVANECLLGLACREAAQTTEAKAAEEATHHTVAAGTPGGAPGAGHDAVPGSAPTGATCRASTEQPDKGAVRGAAARDDDVVRRVAEMRKHALGSLALSPPRELLDQAAEIVPRWLYLGAASHAADAHFFASHNISRVLNCADGTARGHTAATTCSRNHNPSYITIEGRHYLELGAEDEEGYDLLCQHLPTALGFLRDARDAGSPILVHCLGGINRSAAIVCAYLMLDGLDGAGTGHPTSRADAGGEEERTTLAMSLDDAATHILQRRPIALSNEDFVRQLARLEQDTLRRPRWILADKAGKRSQRSTAPVISTAAVHFDAHVDDTCSGGASGTPPSPSPLPPPSSALAAAPAQDVKDP